MPVHGESKHLHANAELARRTGVPEKNIVLARDGDTVDLVDGQAKITGTVEAGLVYVDGQTIGAATEDTLAERRLLSGGGVVTVVALIDPKTNQPTEPLEFLTKGFVHDDRTFASAETQMTKALARAKHDKIDDIGEIEDLIVEAVSSSLRRVYRREPLVMAVVVDDPRSQAPPPRPQPLLPASWRSRRACRHRGPPPTADRLTGPVLPLVA